MKKLIIVVDVDDDLGKKAGVSGPIIGEKHVINSGISLISADPEDSDGNAIFKALKLYRQFKKEGEDVEIVILTGDERLGAYATMKISKQLDIVLENVSASSCIVITDGKSDNEVLPIINSRLKIEGTETIYVKQSKELESTYFLLLEKFKDPTYSKYILGIPALFLIAFSIMYLFNISWQYLGFIIGIYLLIKGFGWDNRIKELFNVINLGNKLYTMLFYTALFLFLLVGFITSYSAYKQSFSLGLSGVESFAYSMDVLLNILGFIISIILIVKLIEEYMLNESIHLLNTLSHLIILIGIFVILKSMFLWILNLNPPYITFELFLYITLITSLVIYLVVEYIEKMKLEIIISSDLKGKEAFYTNNIYIGKIIDVDEKSEIIKVKTQLNKIISVPFKKLKMLEHGKLIVEM